MPRNTNHHRYRETYKDILIDITDQDEKVLANKVRIRKNEIDAGAITRGSSMTVEQLGKKWLTTKEVPVVQEKVYEDYKIRLNKYIYPYIGKYKLSNVEKSDTKEVMRRCANMSFSLRCKVRTTLSAIFNYAIDDHIITSNPAHGLKIGGKRPKRRALTDYEDELFHQVCRKHYAGLWAELLYNTGLRPQESAPLRWEDIDKNKHKVIINKALKSDGKIGPPKTEAGFRSVPIPITFYSQLMLHEGAPDELIFKTEHTKNSIYGGQMMNYQTMKRRWKSIIREMEILAGREVYRNQLIGESKFKRGLTLYCLRHTYCTNEANKGVLQSTLMRNAGHSTSEMLNEIYIDVEAEKIENAQKHQTGTSAGTRMILVDGAGI
jgi:Site-specific recombinase XerD